VKINLEINNTTQSPIADDFFQAVAEKTLEAGFGHLMSMGQDGQATSNVRFLAKKNISISLALVSPEEIRKLNQQYRQYDSVTDILSFAEYGSLEQIKAEKSEDMFLGELILCYNDVKQYAEKENIKLEQELANVISHGVLHLLGFEHGEKMFGIQNTIKNKI